MEEKRKAGRPAGEHGAKKSHTVRVSEQVKDFLAGVNSSVLVENLIRESEAFKQWASQQ